MHNHEDQEPQPENATESPDWYYVGFGSGSGGEKLSRLLWLLGGEAGVLTELEYEQIVSGHEDGTRERQEYEQDLRERADEPKPSDEEIPF